VARPMHDVVVMLCEEVRQSLGIDMLRYVEVGVDEGQTLVQVLTRCDFLLATAVDCWMEDPAHETTARAALAPFGNRVVIRVGLSVEVAAQSAKQSQHVVLVDAAHDYTSVAADLSAWWPIVAPGGLMCTHDYNRSRRRKLENVVRAVDEFAAKIALPVELYACSGKLACIRKPRNV